MTPIQIAETIADAWKEHVKHGHPVLLGTIEGHYELTEAYMAEDEAHKKLGLAVTIGRKTGELFYIVDGLPPNSQPNTLEG